MATAHTIDIKGARRLALLRAGLLKPAWTGMPRSARGAGKRARDAAHAIIRRFGYLQLDTVSVAGARSHALVLHSRLDSYDPALAEGLLQPDEPLFEYWGHEACWLPMSLYPAFEFRRREFRVHPWWGDLITAHPREVDALRGRIRDEGPLRSLDLEGPGGTGWWDHKISKRVATALWSSGELAIRERRNFQRTFDLAERVIPETLRKRPLPRAEAFEVLLLRALSGHGWATTGTLAATWRLKNCRGDIDTALAALAARGAIAGCALTADDGRRIAGWIRTSDLDIVERLRTLRPRQDGGVLLSPFDPVLWDRARVKLLFGFDQVLEIFKPAASRQYGYFCMPVLAGETLVGRVDIKAQVAQRRLQVRALHLEADTSAARDAMRSALLRYAGALQFDIDRAGAGKRMAF